MEQVSGCYLLLPKPKGEHAVAWGFDRALLWTWLRRACLLPLAQWTSRHGFLRSPWAAFWICSWKQCIANCFLLYTEHHLGNDEQLPPSLMLKGLRAVRHLQRIKLFECLDQVQQVYAHKGALFPSVGLWHELDKEELILCGSLSLSATMDNGHISLVPHV